MCRYIPAIGSLVVLLMFVKVLRSTKLILFTAILIRSLLAPLPASSQTPFSQKHLQLISNEQAAFVIGDTLITDSMLAVKFMNNYLHEQHMLGYFEASVDSQIVNDTIWQVFVHIGPRYRWAQLNAPEIPPVLQSKGLQWRFESEQKIGLSAFQKWAEQMLTTAENHGYPFASIGLDSIAARDSALISAHVHLDLHTYFSMDTIAIWGDSVVDKNFLYNYLGFRPGDPYNESRVKQIDRKLDQLPFIKRNGPSRVYFIRNKVLIIVRIQQQKNSQFDGIVGFAPNSENASEQLLLTGELNLDIQNLFRQGVALRMFWRSFLNNSQELKLAFESPYLLKTPLGPQAALDFVRFDTLFTDARWSAGFKYRIDNGLELGFVYEQRNTGLLGIDTALLRSSRKLPGGNPTLSRMYGLQSAFSMINRSYNPSKGMRYDLAALVGNKQIQRDARIEQLRFFNASGESYNLYDSLPLNNLQWNMSFNAEAYLPIKKSSTLAFLFSGKYWISQEIFFNELFRLGGYGSLRGFDENSFYASSYTIGRIEWRYLYSERGHAGVFINGGFYKRTASSNLEAFSDWPVGFGAMARVELGNGLLNLAYALGREQQNPLQFRTAKVHFGLINFF